MKSLMPWSVKPLTKVLGQSEEVKDLVDEAAEELSSVSAVLRQEVADRGSPPGIEEALERTETIEDKVQVAADKLSEVNLALKEEVRERHVLEFRLAAVTERAEASRNAAFHDLINETAVIGHEDNDVNGRHHRQQRQRPPVGG